jgi:predicted transcriptional regulator
VRLLRAVVFLWQVPRTPARPATCHLLAALLSCGYTSGMKTAISVPDEVYRGAERLARSTKKSRSRLYVDALKEYLARHAPDEVTEAMNRACAEIGQTEDPFASSAARRILERSEW